MPHVDDGRLNALLDGELSTAERRTVEDHVSECAECARRLAEARAFLSQAGELLEVLTPPAAPEAPKTAAPAAKKTAREVAVSVDGRTEMTPAIRPVFPHEVPQPRKRWNPDLEKLAWAASLVLCLGVGYLANEVYHLRQTVAGSAARTDITAGTAAENGAGPGASAAPAGAGAERRATGESDLSRARGTGVVSGRAASREVGHVAAPTAATRTAPRPATRPTGPKPAVSKPAPSFTQPRAEQLAANEPSAAGRQQPSRVITPTPAAPPAASGALSDMAAPAPAAAAPNAGLGARSSAGAAAERARADDELTAATTFRRVPMDTAVRRLSGNIRLIDGMNPLRVDVGPGRLVPGADPTREVVRVTYGTGSRRLVLEQQLGDAGARSSLNGVLPGDTLVTALGPNGNQVRWVDGKFWLSLTGVRPADSLRVLVARVR